MKNESIIKALENQGWKVEKIPHFFNDIFNKVKTQKFHYVCDNGKNKCDWYEEENVSSVQVMRSKEKNRIESDYFPGCHCHSIKLIIYMMNL